MYSSFLNSKTQYFSTLNISEENQKRLNVGYGQIGFSYDQSSASQNNTNEESTKGENQNKDEPPDEAYVPHPQFYIPPDMELVSNYDMQISYCWNLKCFLI